MPTYFRKCNRTNPHRAHGTCGGIKEPVDVTRHCQKLEYHAPHVWEPADQLAAAHCPGLKWQTLTESVQEAEKWAIAEHVVKDSVRLTGVPEEQDDWDAEEEDDDSDSRCNPTDGCQGYIHRGGCPHYARDLNTNFHTGNHISDSSYDW